MSTGEKRPTDQDIGPETDKRIKPSNEDLEIWNVISLEKLDIKALYQYIKVKGNKFDIVNSNGYGLLYLAAHNNSIEALRILLLQPDIDVNQINGPQNELALHVACSHGLFDAVELLLENGSKLEVKDSLGYTPLHNAVFSCSLPCVNLLLDNTPGADPQVTDTYGSTLMHLAASRDFASAILPLAAKGVPVDSLNQRGLSPLAIAISFGHIDTAMALIDNGADVNGRTRFSTVLHHAVTWNRLEVVKKLVENKCNVNVVNASEETPLYLAVQQRKIDMVQYLIEEGKADPCFMPDDPSSTSNVPLYYAANHGYTEMCLLLLNSNTSTFFIQVAADMSKRAGFLVTEKALRDKLNNSTETTTPPSTADAEKDDEAAFSLLFNTFSDEE